MTWDSAPDLLKVPEAAELLRVSEKTIRRRLNSDWGERCALKIGHEWRIEKSALREVLKERPIREKNSDPMPQTGRARFREKLASLEGAA